MEPSWLVVDAPVVSPGITQGLLIWVGLRAQWVLRCARRFLGEAYSKEIVIAKWLSVCRSWQWQQEISISRRDLWHFMAILEDWFKPGVSIERRAPRLVITPPSKQQQRAAKKQRLAEDRELFEAVFTKKQKGGWDVVFTDGSSKIAYQQLTGGYGVWYGEADARNRSFVLSKDEDQTNNRGELRAAHYVLSRQPAGKPLHMIVDSEWVYKGVTELGEVWQRHRWHTAMGDVAHRTCGNPFWMWYRSGGICFPYSGSPPTLRLWVMRGQTSWQRKGGLGIGLTLVSGLGRYSGGNRRSGRHWAYKSWIRKSVIVAVLVRVRGGWAMQLRV